VPLDEDLLAKYKVSMVRGCSMLKVLSRCS